MTILATDGNGFLGTWVIRRLRAEARGGRLYPGEGELWLPEFVAAFPPGTPVAIEVPSARHAASSLLERASLAIAATRKLLSKGAPVVDATPGAQSNQQVGPGRPAARARSRIPRH